LEKTNTEKKKGKHPSFPLVAEGRGKDTVRMVDFVEGNANQKEGEEGKEKHNKRGGLQKGR